MTFRAKGKIMYRNSLLLMIGFLLILSGCGPIQEIKKSYNEKMESKDIEFWPNFTTKTIEKCPYKIVIENMRRKKLWEPKERACQIFS